MKKSVLLIFCIFFTVSAFGQNSQIEVLNFQKALSELCQLQDTSSANLFIEKGKEVVSLYENMVSIDSTLAEPYLLFVPYKCIAYGYEKTEDYTNAANYYMSAVLIAVNNMEQLKKIGFNFNGYLSLLESLSDVSAKSDNISQAIEVSKEIVKTCEQVLPTKASYEQMLLWSLYDEKGEEENALEAAKYSLCLYERLGNSESGFYITTPLVRILLQLVNQKRYVDVLNFMNIHRNVINSHIGEQNSEELKELALVNQCMYHSYMALKKYEKAVDAAFLVANYEKEINGTNSAKHAIWLHNVACAYLGIYQTEKSEIILSKIDTLLISVEKIWSLNPNKSIDNHYATFLGTKGVFLSSLGMYDKAEPCYVQSLSIHQKNRASEDVVLKDLERLATFYYKTNHVNEAISQYSSLLGRYTQLGDSLEMASATRVLSVIYADKLHDYKQAERYAFNSYSILKQYAPMSLEFAYAESNLASIYTHLGLINKAVEFRIHSMQLKSTLANISTPEMLDMYSDFIDAYNSVLEYYPDTLKWFTSKAIPFCEKVKEDISASIEDRILSIKILAKINMFSKNFNEAEKQFEKCAEMERREFGSNSECYLTTLNNLSYTYLLSGQYDKCRDVIEKIIRTDKSEDNFYNYENLLGVAVLSKDSLLAESTLKRIYNSEVDYVVSHFLFMSSDQRNEFIDANTGVGNLILPSFYFPMSDICAQYAYNSVLFSKGLLMNATREIESIASQSDNINIKELYNKLLEVRQGLEEANDSATIGMLNIKKEYIEKRILEEIGTSNELSLLLKKDWKDVQHVLNEKETAVEFFTVDNSVLRNGDETEYYGAAILKKDWKSPKIVKLSSKNDIDKIAKRIIDSFNHGNGLRGSQWNYLTKQLYQKVWKPLMQYVDEGDAVYFSPIDLLSLTPMEALTESDGIPICDRYKLKRLSSTRELCLKDKPEECTNAVLFGGLTYTAPQDIELLRKSGKDRKGWQELPATLEEVESIAKKLLDKGGNVKLLERMNGTEDVFKGLSGQKLAFLHIATHGFYYSDKEMNTLDFLKSIDVTPDKEQHVTALKRTGLMLSGSQAAWLGKRKDKSTNDGILLSSEISALDFHKVQLVVLSACQTGLGDISDDGVVGLQRAFKMAGVRSLVMTLWKVDDNATAYMMDNFYTQLLLGKSKQQAFDIAQKKVKEEFKEPFYWAPFILLD